MRVLIVTNTYPPVEITGVGALAWELARQLERGGHRARVLTREAPSDDPHAIATRGRKLFFPLAAGLSTLRLARREPFDLVHVHESDGVMVALLLRLARLLGRPAGRARLVATLQVSYRQERLAVRPLRAAPGGPVASRPTVSERRFALLRAPVLSLLGRITARLADAVVAPSRVTAGELERDYGAREVHVIPNGVGAPEPASEAVAEPEEDGPSVLYAGRLRTRKAVAVLVEAWVGVLAEHPSAVLVLAGDGEQRPALERRVRELGIGASVRFLGVVPRREMALWYARARVFCLPSLYEGFPVAILEAMAAGLPVVSTTVSGIPEAVDHGTSGLLVPPEDAPALAAALSRLLGDEDLRRRMGRAARHAVVERFTIERVADAYLELWKRLL